MLINIMYHHVNSDACSNDLQIFEKHLEYISKNYTTLFVGETVAKKSLCLIFDDAYADFYYEIFPLLKKYNLKAVLAVPTKYILETSINTKENRLKYKHDLCFEKYQEGTFCTWEEIKEMSESGIVQLASHSHSHKNLLENDVNLEEELLLSKKILEEKLGTKIDSFVFPFGKYNEQIAKESLKHYDFIFRIGNAIHKDFSGIKGINYRINGDNLKKEDEIFSFKNMIKYKLKALIKGYI